MRLRIGLVVVLVVLAGCSGGGSSDGGSDVAPTPEAPVELTQGDGCGEAFFWAASADGRTAVVVSVRANLRSEEEPTTIPVDVPDVLVTVEVLRGEDLPQNFCTDLIRAESEPESRTDARSGKGEIVLQPQEQRGNVGCGSSSRSPNGTLHLTGVVADDGTEFAPIDVETSNIGCYSG